MQYKYKSVAQLELFFLIKKFCVKDVYYSNKSSIHSPSITFPYHQQKTIILTDYLCQAKYYILHALRIMTYAGDVHNIDGFLKPIKYGVTTKIRSLNDT